MTDKPIIFSAPMIRALLDGRKTQTRRVLRKTQSDAINRGFDAGSLRLPYAPCDRLYVREHWRASKDYDAYPPREMSHWPVHYEADGTPDPRDELGMNGRFRQGMHMPRWASRITLTVTDVRVQRLQDISEADAMAEGAWHKFERGDIADDWFSFADHLPWRPDYARTAFADLWNSLHGSDAWAANPWVVALTFKVHRGNIDTMDDTK